MERNTKQYERLVTGRRSRQILIAAVVLLSAALIVGVLVYRNTRPYEPPAFDESAVEGEPTVPEGLGYGTAESPSDEGFSVGLASKWVRAEDGSLSVWFTSPAKNKAFLLMRITRKKDEKILYESGLLRPGAYIEQLQPLAELPSGPIDVDVAVYSFDPETYYSLGTFRLSGTVE